LEICEGKVEAKDTKVQNRFSELKRCIKFCNIRVPSNIKEDQEDDIVDIWDK